MEKESKVKMNRTSASAKNQNDINIRVVVGETPKKRKQKRRPKASAPAPAPVQNIVQLPPTTVAVPNITFGRPDYNFVAPRPYDSAPEDGGMRVVSFPELQQNYQARQELMGFPNVYGNDAFSELTAPPEVAPQEEESVATITQEAPAETPMPVKEESVASTMEVPPEVPEPATAEVEEAQRPQEELTKSEMIFLEMDAIPKDSEGKPIHGYKTRYKNLLIAYRKALREERR